MKILHRFVCLFLALAISFPLLSLIACNDSDKDGSDNVSSETEVKKMDYSSYSAPKIAKWYGNKKAAVTLTFDDGQIETGEYIAELFSDLGLRGTMFMILEHYLSERTPREGTAAYEEWISRWQSVADTGTLDIGNHSYHHYSNVMYRDGVPVGKTKIMRPRSPRRTENCAHIFPISALSASQRRVAVIVKRPVICF